MFLAILPSILRSRAAVELENQALRHQIGALQRSAATRPKLTSGDRLFWIRLSRRRRDWRSALAIVKPETVLAWHRAGFRLFWTWNAASPTWTTTHFAQDHPASFSAPKTPRLRSILARRTHLRIGARCGSIFSHLRMPWNVAGLESREVNLALSNYLRLLAPNALRRACWWRKETSTSKFRYGPAQR